MSIVFFYLFMPGEPMIVSFSFCENNFRIKICISTIFKGELLVVSNSYFVEIVGLFCCYRHELVQGMLIFFWFFGTYHTTY